MKNFVSTLLLTAFFYLFQNQALAQKGSIDALLKENGCAWGNPEVPTSAFDDENGLDGKVQLSSITLSPGKETTASAVYGEIAKNGATPLNLKQTLQWMASSVNSPVKFISAGKNVLCLGSHIDTPDGRTGYPVLIWEKDKWFVYITGDIRRAGEATIMIDQNR
jgi:hypothetical protein